MQMQERPSHEQYESNRRHGLGNMYFEGRNVPKNLEKAATLYRSAGELGHSLAQDRLGEMYDRGDGVPQDYHEAFHWFRSAAEQGEPAALYHLGAMYTHGRGVPQDYSQAYMWFSVAVARGYAAGSASMAEISHFLTPEQIAEAINLAQTTSSRLPRTDDTHTGVVIGGDYFAGKTEVICLVVIGIVSLAGFIIAFVEAFPRAVLLAAGAVACVFALPFALIVIAVTLVTVLQIFTPGGGSAIPLFGWKGSVDGLSLAQRREFEAKPRMVRFAKVYLWLAVNSLVGALAALVAFACLYAFMQFAQQRHQ